MAPRPGMQINIRETAFSTVNLPNNTLKGYIYSFNL